MRLLLMGCGALTLLMVLIVGGCGLLAWRSVATMPPDAERAVLFPANRSLIERIDGIIGQVDGVMDAAQRLRDGIGDERVLYLEVSDGADPTPIPAIKRLTWSGQSITVINGAGAGTLLTKFDRRDIRIIASSAPARSGSTIAYRLYLDHPPSVEAPAAKAAP